MKVAEKVMAKAKQIASQEKETLGHAPDVVFLGLQHLGKRHYVCIKCKKYVQNEYHMHCSNCDSAEICLSALPDSDPCDEDADEEALYCISCDTYFAL